jgi:hypothetical protein
MSLCESCGELGACVALPGEDRASMCLPCLYALRRLDDADREAAAASLRLANSPPPVSSTRAQATEPSRVQIAAPVRASRSAPVVAPISGKTWPELVADAMLAERKK